MRVKSNEQLRQAKKRRARANIQATDTDELTDNPQAIDDSFHGGQ